MATPDASSPLSPVNYSAVTLLDLDCEFPQGLRQETNNLALGPKIHILICVQ